MDPRSWEDLSADEKLASRLDRWCDPGAVFTSAEAEAEYKARIDRIIAALGLRRPDRVPVCLNIGYRPAVLAGMTAREAMTDPVRAGRAWVDFNLKFQPDGAVPPLPGANSAQMLEALDYRLYSWPGHGVADDASFQYNEKEWMRAEEYDHLISDTSDFLLRGYLPRAVGAFAGFARLSSLLDFTELPFVWGHMVGWGSPEMIQGLERLTMAARAVGEWAPATFATFGELTALGFPGYYQAMCKAPFDILSDTLRGTRGMMLDMYRCPEKVLAACERLVPVTLDWVFKRERDLTTPVIMLPLHKGADGFMSDEQFRTFYWPSLRAVLLGLIDEGMIPLCFAEGRFDSRLEMIMDLPKGRTVWAFDQTDMARAKETIGRVACIQGNVPVSLIHAGSPEEVGAYTRGLIDTAGEGGGYILDVGASPDDGLEENLTAMINTAKQYGVY
ncbi:MAG: uroporphyrinogen decarboxylase [Thermoleophilia bacterium]|nr:uroporphyrinogen decarboxylase [Thermoleophilia bacterium]